MDDIKEDDLEIEIPRVIVKKNNLNTQWIPPVMMLASGLVSLLICIFGGYSLVELLFVVFITMLIFVIIGVVIRSIVDNFDMHIDYEDLLQDEEEIIEK